jgi:hypothetical protein
MTMTDEAYLEIVRQSGSLVARLVTDERRLSTSISADEANRIICFVERLLLHKLYQEMQSEEMPVDQQPESESKPDSINAAESKLN